MMPISEVKEALPDVTDRMLGILRQAHFIARDWGHTKVGAEHVLAAICEEKGNLARGSLECLGVNVEDVAPLLREMCDPKEKKELDPAVLLSMLEGKTEYQERFQIIQKWERGEYEETHAQLKSEMSKAEVEVIDMGRPCFPPERWARLLVEHNDADTMKGHINSHSLLSLAKAYLECIGANERVNKEADALNEELIRLRKFREHVLALADEGKRLSKTTES